MSRFHRPLAGFALAAGVLIPAGVAQAGPTAPAAVPAAHQVAAVPGSSTPASRAPAGTVRAASARAASGTIKGCPSGDACMYTVAGWNSGHPEHKYYRYVCYNLSNESGTRVIYNNQTGGAAVTLYKNYHCTDPAWLVPDGNYSKGNITPIDSISLNP